MYKNSAGEILERKYEKCTKKEIIPNTEWIHTSRPNRLGEVDIKEIVKGTEVLKKTAVQ